MLANPTSIFVTGSNNGVEPAFSKNYEFRVLSSGFGGEPSPEDINWSVNSVSPGSRIITSTQWQLFNRVFNLPQGLNNSQAATITLNAYDKGGVYAWVNRWMDRVYNPRTGEVGIISELPGGGVGGTAELISYDNGGKKVLSKVVYNQMWPSQLRALEMSRENNSVLQFLVTFEINDISFDFSGIGG